MRTFIAMSSGRPAASPADSSSEHISRKPSSRAARCSVEAIPARGQLARVELAGALGPMRAELGHVGGGRGHLAGEHVLERAAHGHLGGAKLAALAVERRAHRAGVRGERRALRSLVARLSSDQAVKESHVSSHWSIPAARSASSGVANTRPQTTPPSRILQTQPVGLSMIMPPPRADAAQRNHAVAQVAELALVDAQVVPDTRHVLHVGADLHGRDTACHRW